MSAVLKETSSHFSWLNSYIWHKIFNHHHIFRLGITEQFTGLDITPHSEWQDQLLAPSQLSPMGFPKDRCWGCCSLLYTGPHLGQSSTHMVFQTSAIQMTPSCRFHFSHMSLQSLMRSQTVSQTHLHGSSNSISNLALVKQSSRFSQPSDTKWWILLNLFLVKLLQVVQNAVMHMVFNQPT